MQRAIKAVAHLARIMPQVQRSSDVAGGSGLSLSGGHLPEFAVEGETAQGVVKGRYRRDHPFSDRLLQILGGLTHHLCDRTDLNQPLDNIGKAQPVSKGQWLS